MKGERVKVLKAYRLLVIDNINGEFGYFLQKPKNCSSAFAAKRVKGNIPHLIAYYG